MKISFNPSNSNKNILDLIKNNKDIIFDLKGHSIFARGVEFKGTDTNTWRDIKINNVSIGSHTLDLRNGSNTTLTNTNGVVTINSTWRPVVDNLTSDSTTSSLSAKQGKVLKSLIDGKSNSDHNHDGRYLKLTGGTMASNALITFADSGSWDTNKGPQGARGGLCWTGQSDQAKLYAEETVGDNLDLVIQFGDDNSNGLSIRNKANTQTSYISSSGVITTGTFKGNLDWSYITNKPSSYTPSAHTHAWNSLTHSSTTENQAILTNGKANGWKLQTLNIARWDNAANNAHSHTNKSVLDGITSALVNSWNTAYNFAKNSGINGSTIKLNGTSITVYSSGTADGRYVKKSGDTMQGVLTIDTTNFGALTIKRNDDANGASIQFRGKSSVYGYIGLNNSTKDKQFLRWSSDTSRVYTILDTSSTYISNGKGVINGTEITQVNNADTLDGAHLSDIKNWSDRTASAYWKAGWYKVASAQTATNIEAFLTLDVNAVQSNGHATLFIRKRADSKPYFICTHNNNLNLADFRLYYNGMSMVLYARVPNDWHGKVFRIISEGREGTYEHIWTLYSHSSGTDPNAISAEGGNPYINPTYSGRVDRSNSSDKANYANSAGNADTLDGYPANGSNDRPYGHIPTIESDGVMEVGRYIDFHNDNNGKHDFSTRLQSTGNYGNEVHLPSVSGTLALINDVNNYYWANVKISTSSSTTTSPTFSNVYLGNSLYLNTRGSNSIYNGSNDSANGVGGPLNNLVFSSWYGVSFTTSCAGLTYTNKNAVSINCRTGQLYAREVQANGFMHTGHNNNDAVLLAGGGYKTLKDFIFLNKSYNYTDNEHYNLAFHKLSGICNNLVWVDGHVKGSITKSFAIDPAVFPYRYDDDPNLNTIYLMTGNNYITINTIGIVTINNATDHKQRVGFFYTGRA